MHFDAPLETVILSTAGHDRFDSARLMQIVEILDRVPTAGVQADTRHAQLVSDFETINACARPGFSDPPDPSGQNFDGSKDTPLRYRFGRRDA